MVMAGLLLRLQLEQLQQLTHQELCAHVHKLQLHCTNLQHKVTNFSSRAGHTEKELAQAVEHVRRLKQDLRDVRKVRKVRGHARSRCDCTNRQ